MWQPIDGGDDEHPVFVADSGPLGGEFGGRVWGRKLALRGAADIAIYELDGTFIADCTLPDDVRLCRQVSLLEGKETLTPDEQLEVLARFNELIAATPDDDEEEERERQRTESERNRAVGLLMAVKAALDSGNMPMLRRTGLDIDAFIRSTAE
jgi:hypothetical protein